MAVHRVTMQEVADACGLSRNTVSKIFNQRGSVPQATQKMVLKKAQELGYIQSPEQLAAPRPTTTPSSFSPAVCQRTIISAPFSSPLLPTNSAAADTP